MLDCIVAGARAGVMGFFAVVWFGLCVVVLERSVAVLVRLWDMIKRGGGKR